MAFHRAFINLSLAVDLDMVAGNFNKPEDFVTFIKQMIKQSIPHYKPEVTSQGIVTKPYVWDDERMEYIQPKLEDAVRKPKVGDKTFSLEDGEGVIQQVEYPDIMLLFEKEDATRYLEVVELTWVESENRWEYGDLERK